MCVFDGRFLGQGIRDEVASLALPGARQSLLWCACVRPAFVRAPLLTPDHF